METITTSEDLIAWQKAHALVLAHDLNYGDTLTHQTNASEVKRIINGLIKSIKTNNK